MNSNYTNTTHFVTPLQALLISLGVARGGGESNITPVFGSWTKLDKKAGQNWTLLDKIGQKLGKFLELFCTSPTDFFEKIGQNFKKTFHTLLGPF